MSNVATHTLSVPEISCEHCRSVIEGAVGPLNDVNRVLVDIDAKTVTVDGGDYDAIVAAIDDAGYDVAD